MILYRVINDDEYERLFKGYTGEENFNVFKCSSGNLNTFNYDKTIQYMHFFKFAEHARRYSYLFGNKLIMCDIPDDVLEQAGYGIYKYSKDRNILIPIPEYIINGDNFKTDYVIKVKPKKSDCIQLVNGMNKVMLYYQLLDDLYGDFLNSGQQFDNNKFIVYILKYFNGNDIDDIIFEYANSNKITIRKMKK